MDVQINGKRVKIDQGCPEGPDQDWEEAARTLIEKCFAPMDREKGMRKLEKLLQKNPGIALGRGDAWVEGSKSSGVSLAWLAAFFDLHEAVEMLAPLSKLDEAAEGDTPLMLACLARSDELGLRMAKALWTERGILRKRTRTHRKGETAVHNAMACGNSQTCIFLLEAASRRQLRALDKIGDGLLHFAVMEPADKSVEKKEAQRIAATLAHWLSNAPEGCVELERRNQFGRTPALEARMAGHSVAADAIEAVVERKKIAAACSAGGSAKRSVRL